MKKVELQVEDCLHGHVYVVQARNISGVVVWARVGDHVYFFGLREKFGVTFVMTTEHGAPTDRKTCSAECGGGHVYPIARLPVSLPEGVKLTIAPEDGGPLADFLVWLQERYIAAEPEIDA